MKIRYTGSLLSLIAVMACADDSASTEPPRTTVPMQRVERVAGFGAYLRRSDGHREQLDEYFARLADSVPGFAGLYYDENGDAVVALTDDNPGKRRLLAATLRQFLAAGANGRPGSRPALRFVSATYDSRQLLDWSAWASLELMGLSGATSIYIDDARDSVVVGAVDAGTRERLHRRIAQANAPIAVEISGYVRPMSDSLTSPRAAAVGGMMVSTDGLSSGSANLCTLGFNAQRSSNTRGLYDFSRYAIIAGHCTAILGAYDGVSFWNPSVVSASRRKVGYEYREAQYYPKWTQSTCPQYQICYVNCPFGAVCSLADAAMIKLDDAYAWEPARILRTTFVSDHAGSTPGSLEVSEPDSRFIVQDSAMFIPKGMAMCYMGSVTGYVCGFVVAKGIGLYLADHYGNPTNNFVLSMDAVNVRGKNGDSGAPVFFSSGDPAYQHLAGIVAGGLNSNMYFSEYANIAYALLYRDQSDICGSDFNCFLQLRVSDVYAGGVASTSPDTTTCSGTRIVCPTVRADGGAPERRRFRNRLSHPWRP